MSDFKQTGSGQLMYIGNNPAPTIKGIFTDSYGNDISHKFEVKIDEDGLLVVSNLTCSDIPAFTFKSIYVEVV